MSYICGVDIGGTFTDCVIIGPDGGVTISKSPSTPDDFSKGFFEALRLGAAELKLSLRELMAQTAVLSHGTTVVTNALVENRGSKVGLITTAGHGDAILIMRAFGRVAGLSPAETLRFSGTRKPDPIVPRALIREIPERVDSKGDVVVKLNESSVRKAIRELVDAGVEGIAISLLWSFRNPLHEHRVRDLVIEEAPNLFVTCSSDLVPLLGEYERTVATVMNNFVGPEASRYLGRIAERALKEGLESPLLLMQCNGGLTSVADARESPLLLLQSGPCGGVVGSQFLGKLMGYDNIIATDMGGTTFDVGLVHDGRPMRTSSTIVNQYEFFVPTIDIKSIGAGGGSIAWYDQQRGALCVGPRSAGAMPGPICYRRGGQEPTVTDADVVLGYIDPDFFLGGREKLDRQASWDAIARLGDQIGLDPYETAAGINRIVDFHMADLIRRETIEKGLDPRDFVLFTYGGAGASHAGVYARELGVSEVIVPLMNAASVWSALGVASSDVIHIHQKNDQMQAPFQTERVRRTIDELKARAYAQMKGQGFVGDRVSLRWTVDLRYRLQIQVVEVELPDIEVGPESLVELLARFKRSYEALYGEGTAYAHAGIELVTIRCTASAAVQKPALSFRQEQSSTPAAVSVAPARTIYWPELKRTLQTPIFRAAFLAPGNIIEGPAVIEPTATTIVVRPGQRARLDGFGNIVITLESREAK
jgi:N-methylhydantoinase A